MKDPYTPEELRGVKTLLGVGLCILGIVSFASLMMYIFDLLGMNSKF